MNGEFEFKTPQDVAERLARFKFKQRFFGGLDEANVWEGLKKLNSYYEQVYLYQQTCFQTLLTEREEEIQALKRKIDALQQEAGP